MFFFSLEPDFCCKKAFLMFDHLILMLAGMQACRSWNAKTFVVLPSFLFLLLKWCIRWSNPLFFCVMFSGFLVVGKPTCLGRIQHVWWCSRFFLSMKSRPFGGDIPQSLRRSWVWMKSATVWWNLYMLEVNSMIFLPKFIMVGELWFHCTSTDMARHKCCSAVCAAICTSTIVWLTLETKKPLRNLTLFRGRG